MKILTNIIIVCLSATLGFLLNKLLNMGKLKEHKLIKKQAITDQLTGKGNRHKFVEDLEYLISKKKKFAVCFMDLDGFKNINDTMGHDAGDELLIQLGRKLDENLPQSAESYRLGGDEFAILMKDVNTVGEISKNLDNLKKGLTQPIVIENVKITLEYSLGVAIYPTDADNRIELMTYADDAMYYIKENGKNDYYFHNKVLKAKLENKKKMEISIKAAIEKEEFTVEYTPRIDVKNRKNICMESKIVWVHPVLGRIDESYFMKYAEEIGVILSLDEYLIKKTCEKIVEIKEKYNKDVKMFVNICNLHISRNDFIDKVKNLVGSYNLKSGSLELCFSRRLSLKHLNNYKRFVESMKEVGCLTSISNLELKLDILRTFKEIDISSIRLDASCSNGNSEFNNAVISDIVNVCKDLDYGTEIVGISSKEQLERILETKADYVQGDYIYRSIGEDELMEFIENYDKLMNV